MAEYNRPWGLIPVSRRIVKKLSNTMIFHNTYAIHTLDLLQIVFST